MTTFNQFKFEKIDNNSTLTLEVKVDGCQEIVDEFITFMRGCGFMDSNIYSAMENAVEEHPMTTFNQFKFEKIDNNSTLTLEVKAGGCQEIVDEFITFMRGCGFMDSNIYSAFKYLFSHGKRS